MVLYKILVNIFQNLVKLHQKSIKFHNLTKFWLKLFETISKFSMSRTASMASFNVKGPRPGLLTRNTRVSGNKYKMADALHSVARKSQLILMLSQRARVGTPDRSH